MKMDMELKYIDPHTTTDLTDSPDRLNLHTTNMKNAYRYAVLFTICRGCW